MTEWVGEGERKKERTGQFGKKLSQLTAVASESDANGIKPKRNDEMPSCLTEPLDVEAENQYG